jgi:hypothetical protein
MTRSQLEAAAGKVQQSGDDEVKKQLTPGAAVYDRAGAVAATVDHVDETGVIIKVGTKLARLPVSAFSKSEQGAAIDSTAAELEASVAAQAPPPSPGSPPPKQ